jgi:hypothetical protein
METDYTGLHETGACTVTRPYAVRPEARSAPAGANVRLAVLGRDWAIA